MRTRWRRLWANAGWSGVLRTMVAGLAVVGFAIGGPLSSADLWPLPVGAIVGIVAPWLAREPLLARLETVLLAHRATGVAIFVVLAVGRDALKTAPPPAQGAALGVLAAYLSIYVLTLSDPGVAPTAATEDAAPTAPRIERGCDTYALPDRQSLNELAARLEALLGVPLTERLSPMDGPWFSSALDARGTPDEPAVSVTRWNSDPEYGAVPPPDPERPIMVSIDGPPHVRRDLGARLLAADLDARRLPPGT